LFIAYHYGKFFEFLVGTFVIYSFVLISWGSTRIYQRIRQGDLTDNNGKLVDSPGTLLLVFTIVPLVFFVVVLFRANYVDASWACLSMTCFYIWLGGESSRLWKEGKRKKLIKIYFWAFVVNFIIIGLTLFHVYSPIIDYDPESRDPAYPLIGWKETGAKVEKFLRENSIPLPDYVVSNEYPLATQFALHLPSNPRSYATGRVGRNLWSDPRNMNRKNTIFVCESMDECEDLEEDTGETIGFIIKKVGNVQHRVRGTTRIINIYRITGKDFSLLTDEKDLRL